MSLKRKRATEAPRADTEPAEQVGPVGPEESLNLWKEHKRSFGERSHEELDYYIKNRCWPEQKGRLHYSLQNGKLGVEWQFQPQGEDQREKN